MRSPHRRVGLVDNDVLEPQRTIGRNVQLHVLTWQVRREQIVGTGLRHSAIDRRKCIAQRAERYFGVQFFLEDLLACSVDLVTEKALRPELRAHVEKDRVHV